MTIPEEVFQKYRRAGKIVAEVRERAKKIVREGMPIIDLCEKVEALIRERGGKSAFPCNVSANEIAAHFTSPPRDKRTIPEKSVVKIDLGAHVDGYIADTAVTVCFNPEYENLVETAERALEKAVEILRPGLSISQFGSTIQGTIKSYGCKPVSNLTGHQVGRYLIHTGKSLPNVPPIVPHFSLAKISAGEVYGVEPFVTVPDAAGKVNSGSETFIFRFLKPKSLKNPDAKRLLDHIKKNFHTLPFTERWLQGIVPNNRYKAAFLELLLSKSLMAYPVFIEESGKPVAQAEHTVMILKDGCLVLT
jgi:methionyl aminopeptidase